METLVTTWTGRSCPYRSHWSRSRGRRPQAPRPTAWSGRGEMEGASAGQGPALPRLG